MNINTALNFVAQSILKIPENCITEVKCVDCGKTVMSIGCCWQYDEKIGKGIGPRCGCFKRTALGGLSI